MIKNIKAYKNSCIYKAVILCLLISFGLMSVAPQEALAQTLSPTINTLIPLSPAFTPTLVRGIRVYPDNPLKFDFIVDSGDSGLQGDELKSESEKLIRYFLASLTLPENDLWVNLSPYEKDRIVPAELGTTEMGIDMLAQDYLLKQITASLTNPDSDLGKEFWQKIYKQSYEKFGTTNVPVDTFNKVWIMPDKAEVYVQEDKAFVVESRLKVMLEEDYLALSRSSETSNVKRETQDVSRTTIDASRNTLASDIVREVFIPVLEKEVNEGKNFAQLRQIYNSIILSYWYKTNLKNSILNKVYADKRKMGGLKKEDRREKIEDGKSNDKTRINKSSDSLDSKTLPSSILHSPSSASSLTSNISPLTSEVDSIYQQYLQTFKKGVCNMMKVEYDPYTKKNIPRKYFAGGVEIGFGAATGNNLSTTGDANVIYSYVEKNGMPKKTFIMEVAVSDPSVTVVGDIAPDWVSDNTSASSNVIIITDEILKDVRAKIAVFLKDCKDGKKTLQEIADEAKIKRDYLKKKIVLDHINKLFKVSGKNVELVETEVVKALIDQFFAQKPPGEHTITLAEIAKEIGISWKAIRDLTYQDYIITHVSQVNQSPSNKNFSIVGDKLSLSRKKEIVTTFVNKFSVNPIKDSEIRKFAESYNGEISVSTLRNLTNYDWKANRFSLDSGKVAKIMAAAEEAQKAPTKKKRALQQRDIDYTELRDFYAQGETEKPFMIYPDNPQGFNFEYSMINKNFPLPEGRVFGKQLYLKLGLKNSALGVRRFFEGNEQFVEFIGYGGPKENLQVHKKLFVRLLPEGGWKFEDFRETLDEFMKKVGRGVVRRNRIELTGKHDIYTYLAESNVPVGITFYPSGGLSQFFLDLNSLINFENKNAPIRKITGDARIKQVPNILSGLIDAIDKAFRDRASEIARIVFERKGEESYLLQGLDNNDEEVLRMLLKVSNETHVTRAWFIAERNDRKVKVTDRGIEDEAKKTADEVIKKWKDKREVFYDRERDEALGTIVKLLLQDAQKSEDFIEEDVIPRNMRKKLMEPGVQGDVSEGASELFFAKLSSDEDGLTNLMLARVQEDAQEPDEVVYILTDDGRWIPQKDLERYRSVDAQVKSWEENLQKIPEMISDLIFNINDDNPSGVLMDRDIYLTLNFDEILNEAFKKVKFKTYDFSPFWTGTKLMPTKGFQSVRLTRKVRNGRIEEIRFQFYDDVEGLGAPSKQEMVFERSEDGGKWRRQKVSSNNVVREQEKTPVSSSVVQQMADLWKKGPESFESAKQFARDSGFMLVVVENREIILDDDALISMSPDQRAVVDGITENMIQHARGQGLVLLKEVPGGIEIFAFDYGPGVFDEQGEIVTNLKDIFSDGSYRKGKVQKDDTLNSDNMGKEGRGTAVLGDTAFPAIFISVAKDGIVRTVNLKSPLSSEGDQEDFDAKTLGINQTGVFIHAMLPQAMEDAIKFSVREDPLSSIFGLIEVRTNLDKKVIDSNLSPEVMNVVEENNLTNTLFSSLSIRSVNGLVAQEMPALLDGKHFEEKDAVLLAGAIQDLYEQAGGVAGPVRYKIDLREGSLSADGKKIVFLKSTVLSPDTGGDQIPESVTTLMDKAPCAIQKTRTDNGLVLTEFIIHIDKLLTSSANTSGTKGGIDFNAKNMNVKVKGVEGQRGQGIKDSEKFQESSVTEGQNNLTPNTLNMTQSDHPNLFILNSSSPIFSDHFEGLVPIIINVTPVTDFMGLLGLGEKEKLEVGS